MAASDLWIQSAGLRGEGHLLEGKVCFLLPGVKSRGLCNNQAK